MTVMGDGKAGRAVTGKPWVRIPDGIKVRHRSEGKEGVVEGLTEIIAGSNRNPDGRTQYRVDVGAPAMQLVAEDDLLILTDRDGLVIMAKEKAGYRSFITARLHGAFTDDRFVKATRTSARSGPTEAAKKSGEEDSANDRAEENAEESAEASEDAVKEEDRDQ